MGGMSTRSTVADRLMTIFWRSQADTIAERTRRRVTLYLIPFLFFLYILAYLDRVNVSVAMLDMSVPPAEGGLGLDREVIGFGAGLFFWGYWILEIPSTISVVRIGARWVFVRVLILWGICASLAGLVGTPTMAWMFGWLPHLDDSGFGLLAGAAGFINRLHDSPKEQFYFLRFMLGFFEGGFFPSVIVYLSLWFRPADRAKAVAGFMVAIPISSMIGLPLSGLLLGVHWFGLPGWRWIFILEGVAPILAGIATLFFLPDRPSAARWLRPDEREWLAGELAAEDVTKQKHSVGEWRHHLGVVVLLTLVYFGQNVVSYGISMFMPAIIKSQSGLSNELASYLASVPYVLAFVCMLINGRLSDRSGERFWHAAVPMCLLGLGALTAALVDKVPVLPVVVMIFWVGPVMYAHLPAFWPIPSSVLGATAAAAAIGFINMIGNLGGSVGPTLVGKAAQGQESFAPALLRLAPWPIMSAAVVLALGWWRSKKTSAGR
jgi:ACS family tartrate transporter-like MFS transporter